MRDVAQIDDLRRLPAAVVVVLILTLILLVLPTALIAIALGFGWMTLPYPLFVVLQRLPLIFPLHMIASGFALIVMPVAALARHRRPVHRNIGRLAAAAVVMGGLTALPVALASEAGILARAGLFAQGLAWLALLAAAYVAIRRRNVARHMRLMVAVAAVASGAIWLRVVTALANATGLPFDLTYSVATWACWLVPLCLVAVIAAPVKARPLFAAPLRI
jgi:hypothetical protein